MARQMDLDTTGLTFTRGWFRTRNLSTFRQYVYPEFTGKPITYLEIGVFEGMSMCWMLQHVLTHPESRAVGVDPWLMTRKLDSETMSEVMDRAQSNVSRIAAVDVMKRMLHEKNPTTRAGLVRSTSVEFLHKCLSHGYLEVTKNSVDLCMIDGAHWAPYVADDARLVYRLIRPGGMILFDDVENDHEKGGHVKEGIELWLDTLAREKGRPWEELVRQEWKHRYMEAWRKL